MFLLVIPSVRGQAQSSEVLIPFGAAQKSDSSLPRPAAAASFCLRSRHLFCWKIWKKPPSAFLSALLHAFSAFSSSVPFQLDLQAWGIRSFHYTCTQVFRFLTCICQYSRKSACRHSIQRN